jgi:hypothetical protein
VAQSVEGVKCHKAFGSSDLVGRRIPTFHLRAFKVSTIACIYFFDGLAPTKRLDWTVWLYTRWALGKESFLGDKLSGQPSEGDIPITGLQPVGRIEEASIVNQSMASGRLLALTVTSIRKPPTAWSSFPARLRIIRSAPRADSVCLQCLWY